MHMTLAPLEKPSAAEIASRRMKAETVIKTNKHCGHDVVLLLVSSLYPSHNSYVYKHSESF